MKQNRTRFLLAGLCLLAVATALIPRTPPDILPLRERAQVIDRWLKIRLDRIVPMLMEREDVDMWLVVCREYNEDPLFFSLVPARFYSARRTTMLVFVRETSGTVKRLVVGKYGIRGFYEKAGSPDKDDLWQGLKKVIEARNPAKIAVNQSTTFALADGLSATLEKSLRSKLGSPWASRIVSEERLAVGWLETRIDEELETYPHIVRIAHAIIAEAFSDSVITPGVTRVIDVQWWMRQRISDLGLQAWFFPSVAVQRKGVPGKHLYGDTVIRRGDLLHCDIGITYLRLSTDTQEHGYVLKAGETDVPEGLKQGMSLGNHLQDILLRHFIAGKTGNEILKAALSEAKGNGLKASIYSHPLGFHGHAAGPAIGLWDRQGGVPGAGDYPLFSHTCYAIELNIKTTLPEWDSQEVRIALEQDAMFTGRDTHYLDGRQTRFHIIK